MIRGSRLRLVGVLLLMASNVCWAQPGLEFQVYPAGMQATGIWFEPVGTHRELIGYAGYNLARRWDWGLHSDERGGGPGLGLGYREYLHGLHGLNLSLRCEVWFLDIAWRNSTSETGLSEVTVLQPAIELAWRGLSGTNGAPELGLSLGREINVATNGEAVGQGPILRGRFGWVL
jgi:hypothetical protein